MAKFVVLFFLLCVAAALASKDTATKMVTEDLEPAAQSYYGGNNGGDFGGNGNGGYGHGWGWPYHFGYAFQAGGWQPHGWH